MTTSNFGELSNHYFLTNQNQFRTCFFSNNGKNLTISEFSDSNTLAESILHLIFKEILKYKSHLSIIAIKNARDGPGFCSCGESVNNAFKEI